MQRWASIAAIVLTHVAVLSAAEVSTFGRVAQLLGPSDVTMIARLVPGREVLAIEVDRSQVLPETWLAFAYLAPDSDVAVLLADGPNSGLHAELHYRKGTWRLGRIVIYMA
jgi:hypothetical protein